MARLASRRAASLVPARYRTRPDSRGPRKAGAVETLKPGRARGPLVQGFREFQTLRRRAISKDVFAARANRTGAKNRLVRKNGCGPRGTLDKMLHFVESEAQASAEQGLG